VLICSCAKLTAFRTSSRLNSPGNRNPNFCSPITNASAQKFGLRLPGEFNREDVRKAVNLAHEHDKKVYVAVNGIFHNYHLNALENYIEFLHEIRVDRIIFGDPAVVMYVKKQDNPIPLNWDAETIPIITLEIIRNNCFCIPI
jgi:phosphosulfolactate synthase (CoM biosynthesis protein A)